MDNLRLALLDRRRLGDFERLLGGREFGGCYCALWRLPAEGWEERCKERPRENFEDTRRRVIEGRHVGFLVIREADGVVVGWTGSGPKTAFPLMKDRPGSRLGPFEDSIWAVGCIAVAFSCRSQGYAREIVRLLVEEARKAGARAIEACPLESAEEAGAWRGSKAMYEALGFAAAGSEQANEKVVFRMEKVLAPS
ncbi:MAG: GNAT family N-acetyltransferase [Elusimicrobia bacterium]|nr:GNAT family N-acetyltransferase [Elusimicrobiota bacterium]